MQEKCFGEITKMKRFISDCDKEDKELEMICGQVTNKIEGK